jgi:hypothetical protein
VGGWGSGRRSSWRKKGTVEDCYVLSVGTFREAIQHGRGYCGRVRRAQGEKKVASIGYRLEEVGSCLAARLICTSSDTQRGEKTEANYPVLVQTTCPHLGGRRWWFTCPLVVDGVPCGRRVGKLYLPPRGGR